MTRSRRSTVAWWVARAAGTAAGFAYVAWIVDLDAVGPAIAKVSALAFASACAITMINLAVGALRWRTLLAAYAAPQRPSIATLYRVYLVGFFYNTYLPGGVGGDVVRGMVTRESFGDRGTTASLAVVLIERVLGLAGLLLVVSATVLARPPIAGTQNVLPYCAIGLVAAAAAVFAIATGRRFADKLPGPLGRIARSLPVLERPGPFVLALLLSLVTQILVAFAGHAIVASVTRGAVALADSIAAVPLAAAASYFPLSVGGAGAREAAFVELGEHALGMTRADALACALLMWFAQLVTAALGGILQLVRPLGREAPRDGA